jgi:hypothetical protein
MRLLVLIDGSKGCRHGHTLPSFVYLNGGDFNGNGGVELNGLGPASPGR